MAVQAKYTCSVTMLPGELLGDRINIPSAGSNQGPVHAEWLEPDLIAVTFWTYTSSHRRIELRIVNATDVFDCA